ncbi:hypothetical protein FB472_0048 [Rhodoglobus vestalii]|uniref:DUF4365 domain-containing protein n=1 Tax=Rhodoglobus vestalii TaxID=193384 RepID=A0A8H2PSU9_9MICO|nr:hypothetical protein FB472_0048 [Rhodoglobus vestalii]
MVRSSWKQNHRSGQVRLERTDILTVHTSEQGPMIEVQVKTANYVGGNTNWPLSTKSQQPELSTREWFVMVVLPAAPFQIPRSFIVPRNHVAAAAWLAHVHWLTEPDAQPGTRNAGPSRSRVNVDGWARYEDRWDLLLSPTTDCPVVLPKWMQNASLLDRVARNPNYSWQHPWRDAPPTWSSRAFLAERI